MFVAVGRCRLDMHRLDNIVRSLLGALDGDSREGKGKALSGQSVRRQLVDASSAKEPGSIGEKTLCFGSSGLPGNGVSSNSENLPKQKLRKEEPESLTGRPS